LLVGLRHLGGGELGGRTQHVLAVVALVLLDPVEIHGCAALGDLEIALVPSVADETLDPYGGELVANLLEGRLAVELVLFGLVGVEAHDVASLVLDPDLFGLASGKWTPKIQRKVSYEKATSLYGRVSKRGGSAQRSAGAKREGHSLLRLRRGNMVRF